DCEYGMFKLSNEECVFTDAIDEWSADELSIYPNPTDGQFFVEGQRIATVQIFNAIGQLVSEIENIEDERITINCESWTPGIYNVRIISADGETATRKVTIFR
ncbi:MAG: T9SS type A sorting domain-containing protein, partial [Bacteroidales bacterium]|nr:T9SS type A sorting domain-containing protein [Bacteroidales bacterium]